MSEEQTLIPTTKQICNYCEEANTVAPIELKTCEVQNCMQQYHSQCMFNHIETLTFKKKDKKKFKYCKNCLEQIHYYYEQMQDVNSSSNEMNIQIFIQYVQIPVSWFKEKKTKETTIPGVLKSKYSLIDFHFKDYQRKIMVINYCNCNVTIRFFQEPSKVEKSQLLQNRNVLHVYLNSQHTQDKLIKIIVLSYNADPEAQDAIMKNFLEKSDFIDVDVPTPTVETIEILSDEDNDKHDVPGQENENKKKDECDNQFLAAKIVIENDKKLENSEVEIDEGNDDNKNKDFLERVTDENLKQGGVLIIIDEEKNQEDSKMKEGEEKIDDDVEEQLITPDGIDGTEEDQENGPSKEEGTAEKGKGEATAEEPPENLEENRKCQYKIRGKKYVVNL